MHAAGNNGDETRRLAAVREPRLFESDQPFGKIGEDFGSHLATPPPRAHDSRNGETGEGFGGHYSRISSVNRFLSFIPAAPRMVRMDFAVRPCRPITFPRSVG